ncbi:MAG: hypothetical protein V3V40_06015 [Nitrosomonadaceae bacterium]
MELPKLYAPVKIKFWSLRNKLGPNLGVIFDCDEIVERNVRRVIIPNGWKFQIVNFHKLLCSDYYVVQDKEMLDEWGSDLEFELTDEIYRQKSSSSHTDSVTETLIFMRGDPRLI